MRLYSIDDSLIYLTLLTFLGLSIIVQGSPQAFIIRDLQATNSVQFNNQVDDNWYVWGGGGFFSKCQTSQLLETERDSSSTYSAVGKDYSSLAAHKSVFITMKIYLIDGWSTTDQFFVTIYEDGVLTEQYELGYPTFSWTSAYPSICYSGTRGDLTDITLSIQSKHSVGSLGIRIGITPDYTYSRGDIGVRDVQMILTNQTLTTNTFCTSSQYGSLFSTGTCACSVGKYIDTSTGSCQSCHSSCETCFGSAATQCLSCPMGYGYDGTSCIKCDSTCQTCYGTGSNQCLTCYENQYLKWDDTCQSGCTSPFISDLESGYYYCNCPNDYFYYSRNNTCLGTCLDRGFTSTFRSPLYQCEFGCELNKYYFADGTCKTTCDQYYIPSGTIYKYCDFPCSMPDNEYLFEDGQCLPTCEAPLISWTDNGNHCKRPCTSTDLFYYTYEKTCQSSCPSPYIFDSTGLSRSCNLPCPANEYLFEDGQCIPSCDSPLISSTSGSVNLCHRPCTTPNIYYFPDERICRSSCPQPYFYNTTDLSMSCNLVLSESQQQEIKAVSSVTNVADGASQGFVTASIALSADPAGSSSGMLSKALQYTKYLNITYSSRLETLYKSKNLTSGFIPMLPPISDDLKCDFHLYQVPLRFAKFKVHSSFFVNFWEGLLSLAIVIALWIIMRILEALAFKMKVRFFPYLILKNVRSAVQNFFITQFYTVYGDIMLFSILDMKSNEFDSPAANGSFLLSVMLLVIGVVILFIHIYILKKYQAIRSKGAGKSVRSQRYAAHTLPKALKKFAQDYAGMGIFYMNFKDASLTQQAFFLFLNIRNILFYLTVGFLYDYPVIQAILITFFGMVTIFYLLLKRPFKDVINLIQQICAELMLFIVDICILSLAVLDAQESTDLDSRESLSQLIIWISIALTFVAPVFIAAKAVKAGFMYFHYRQMSKKNQEIKKTGKSVIMINNNQPKLKQLDKAKTSNNANIRVISNARGQTNEIMKSKTAIHGKNNSNIEAWSSKLDNNINQQEILRAKNEQKLSEQMKQYRSKMTRVPVENHDMRNPKIELPRQQQGFEQSKEPINQMKLSNIRQNKGSRLYVQRELLPISTPSIQEFQKENSPTLSRRSEFAEHNY